MFAKIAGTGAVLAVAAVTLLGYGPAPAGFNLAGIALCVGAALVWFGWPAGYSYWRESRRQDGKRPDPVTTGAAPLLREHGGDRGADKAA